MNINQFKKLLNQDSIFNHTTLLNEVNELKLDLNNLLSEFIKFQKSLEIMDSVKYGELYCRHEFIKDIEKITLYVYNGCYIEYNENPSKFYLELYNGGYEGTLYNCEIHLFISFYIYEYITIEKLDKIN